MLIIGAYGVVGAVREHRYKAKKKNFLQSPAKQGSDSVDRDGVSSSSGSRGSGRGSGSNAAIVSTAGHAHKSGDSLPSAADDYSHAEEGLGRKEDESDLLQHSLAHTHAHACAPTARHSGGLPFLDMSDPSTQRVVSVAMGLLHGIAGPGGILGVLPAVEMQHWQSSLLYLGSFMVASTLSMGIFAACYGEATRRIGSSGVSVELGLRVLSSSASIVVGECRVLCAVYCVPCAVQ